MTYHIEYEAETSLEFPYEDIIKKVIEAALEMEKCPYEAEISIILTDNESIKAVNSEYRKIDLPTDVLSFPMIEYKAPSDFSDLEEKSLEYFNPETGELLLGDIIISVDKVIEQADKYGHSIVRELAFLTAHSMFHLLGYDHIDNNESALMEEKQKELMSILQINR
jgi:probable rRNA maturation factor